MQQLCNVWTEEQFAAMFFMQQLGQGTNYYHAIPCMFQSEQVERGPSFVISVHTQEKVIPVGPEADVT